MLVSNRIPPTSCPYQCPAALVSVSFAFGLAYFFTDQVVELMADVRRIERWLILLALMAVAAWIAVIAWRRNRIQ